MNDFIQQVLQVDRDEIQERFFEPVLSKRSDTFGMADKDTSWEMVEQLVCQLTQPQLPEKKSSNRHQY